MLRILIVDDQKIVRKVLMTALRNYGFEAVGVEDAVSALRELETSEYDLAIIDIYMPKIDGVKLIKAMRERARDFRSLPCRELCSTNRGTLRSNISQICPIWPASSACKSRFGRWTC
jgi:CheY-like chemotaxis protein